MQKKSPYFRYGDSAHLHVQTLGFIPRVVGALRLFKSALNSNRSLRGGGQRVGGGGNSCKTEKNGDCLDHGAYFTDFFIPDTLV